MANVRIMIEQNDHSKQINLTSNQRRRMATILLTNIIRLDRFREKWTEENSLIDDDENQDQGKMVEQHHLDSWFECRLSSKLLLFI